MNIEKLEEKIEDLIDKYNKKADEVERKYGAIIVLKGDDVTAEEAIGYADWCRYCKATEALGEVLNMIECKEIPKDNIGE